MIEIRIHGRGGQGAVVASLALANAARAHGYHVQVFPEFGVERRGAPVTAFARLDTRPIRLRTRVEAPGHLLVLDPALLVQTGVTRGLAAGGTITVNAEDDARLGALADAGFRVAWVDASAIAARHKIGTATAPIVNTTLLGAFAAATGLVTLDEVAAGIRATAAGDPERNVAAASEAHAATRYAVAAVSRALQGCYEAGP